MSRHSDLELKLRHLQKHERGGLLETRLHDHRGVHNHPSPLSLHVRVELVVRVRKRRDHHASCRDRIFWAGNGLESARAPHQGPSLLSPPPPLLLPPQSKTKIRGVNSKSSAERCRTSPTSSAPPSAGELCSGTEF